LANGFIQCLKFNALPFQAQAMTVSQKWIQWLLNLSEVFNGDKEIRGNQWDKEIKKAASFGSY